MHQQCHPWRTGPQTWPGPLPDEAVPPLFVLWPPPVEPVPLVPVLMSRE
jgi:hypothetical protein